MTTATLEAKQVLVMSTCVCSVCRKMIERDTKAWSYLCEPCAKAMPGCGNVWLMAHLHCYKPETK